MSFCILQLDPHTHVTPTTHPSQHWWSHLSQLCNWSALSFSPYPPPKKICLLLPLKKEILCYKPCKASWQGVKLGNCYVFGGHGQICWYSFTAHIFFGQESVIEHDNAVEPFTKVCFWATNYVPFEQSLLGWIEAKHPHTPPLVVLGETDIMHQIFLLWGMERTCLDIELEFVLAAG